MVRMVPPAPPSGSRSASVSSSCQLQPDQKLVPYMGIQAKGRQWQWTEQMQCTYMRNCQDAARHVTVRACRHAHATWVCTQSMRDAGAPAARIGSAVRAKYAGAHGSGVISS